MTLITWALTVLSVIGTVLVIKKKKTDFHFWIVTNIGWALVDFAAGLPAQAALFAVYLAVSLYGLYEWRRG